MAGSSRWAKLALDMPPEPDTALLLVEICHNVWSTPRTVAVKRGPHSLMVELEPGEVVLPLRELEAKHGISKNRFARAVAKLEAHGVVERSKRGGVEIIRYVVVSDCQPTSYVSGTADGTPEPQKPGQLGHQQPEGINVVTATGSEESGRQNGVEWDSKRDARNFRHYSCNQEEQEKTTTLCGAQDAPLFDSLPSEGGESGPGNDPFAGLEHVGILQEIINRWNQLPAEIRKARISTKRPNKQVLEGWRKVTADPAALANFEDLDFLFQQIGNRNPWLYRQRFWGLGWLFTKPRGGSDYAVAKILGGWYEQEQRNGSPDRQQQAANHLEASGF